MHEIEAKIRVSDFEAVTERLKANDAKFLHNVQETDNYLDTNGQLKAKGAGLRIRQRVIDNNRKTIITFKGAKVQSKYKSRPEYEIEVSSFDAAAEIFLQLGYENLITVQKNRTVWAIDSCEICLDNVRGLGCFIEVEGPSDDEIESVLKKLDLADKRHIHEGYAEMLASGKIKQGNE